MINSIDLIEAARKLLGVPFLHQGRSTDGVDCAGLVLLAHHACGLEAPDMSGYARIPDGNALRNHIEGSKVVAKSRYTEPGAIVLFRFKNEPQHVGISAGKTLIHSFSQVGKVVEHNWDNIWINRIVCSYKHIGIL